MYVYTYSSRHHVLRDGNESFLLFLSVFRHTSSLVWPLVGIMPIQIFFTKILGQSVRNDDLDQSQCFQISLSGDHVILSQYSLDCITYPGEFPYTSRYYPPGFILHMHVLLLYKQQTSEWIFSDVTTVDRDVYHTVCKDIEYRLSSHLLLGVVVSTWVCNAIESL